MMEIKDNADLLDGVQRALVLGIGRSGLAAARLLKQRGVSVTVCDSAMGNKQSSAASELTRLGMVVLLGTTELPANDFDLCVVSPGIARDSPLVCAAVERGLDVISELELGAALAPFPLLAITGTNGKSSLVKLCADALNAAGKKALACGNYGLPLCDVVSSSPTMDWAVVEVSSFQLELTELMHPRVAVLLNLQADHLDRHGSMQSYRDLKFSLFSQMGAGDTVLLPIEEFNGCSIGKGGLKLRSFGIDADADIVYTAGTVADVESGSTIALNESWFDNRVLGSAAAAGSGALRVCGLSDSEIESAFAGFKPLRHRMQEVALFRGVRFVNDSKATNLAGLIAGIQMSDSPVRLIAGGELKEKKLNKVKELLEMSAKAVYLIGSAARDMESSWQGVIPCSRCGTLERAFHEAVADAQPGETILLSPGCASFDQFSSYAERGERFVDLVSALVHEVAAGSEEILLKEDE